MNWLSNFMESASSPNWEGIGFMLAATTALVVIGTPVLYVIAKIVRRPASLENCIKTVLGTGIIGFFFAAVLFGVVEYHSELGFENPDTASNIMAIVAILISLAFTRHYIVSSLGRALTVAIASTVISYGLLVAVLFSGIVPLT